MQIPRCKQSLRYFKAKTIWSKDGRLNLANQDPRLMIGKNNFWTKFLKRVSEQRSRRILILLQRAWGGPEMKTTSAWFRCWNFWHLNKWPPTLASRKKKIRKPLKVDSPPQAVCSTCVKYQLNLKTKEHLLQMKIKDLRSVVRGLKLGIKGRKKDHVIQVLLRHASDCQLQETASRYAKKHKHIITKVCESYTFIRQWIAV